MSKLYKLKKWLTLQEAINHISVALDEPVTEADIYRFALDKHLTLSVNFVNGACAYLGQRDTSDKGLGAYLDLDKFSSEQINQLNDIWLPSLDETQVRSIQGVWDLTLLGSEAIDLEFNYQKLTSGVEVTLAGLEGVFVKEGDVYASLLTDFEDNEFQDGSKAYCEKIEQELSFSVFKDNIEIEKIRVDCNAKRAQFLKEREKQPEPERYFPSGGLDEHDYTFVVRTSELNQFLRSLEEHEILEDVNNTTVSQLSFSESITKTDAWKNLYKLADKAFNDFPTWQADQTKPHKIPMSHIDEWLKTNLQADKREAETIKKIIIEIFNL
jgi:hypothetical protein